MGIFCILVWPAVSLKFLDVFVHCGLLHSVDAVSALPPQLMKKFGPQGLTMKPDSK